MERSDRRSTGGEVTRHPGFGVKRFGAWRAPPLPGCVTTHPPVGRPAERRAGASNHRLSWLPRARGRPMPQERGSSMSSRLSLLSGAALAAAVLALGTTSLISTAAQAATPPGLHISGTQLVEKDGTPFVARGVSHAHTWYTSQTATTIPAIRAAGANALRVVLSGGDRWTKNDASDVASIIAQCKANKLISVLEDHDTTGYGEQSGAVHARHRGELLDEHQERAGGPGGLRHPQHRQRAVSATTHGVRHLGAPTPRTRSRSCAPPASSTRSWSTPRTGVRTGPGSMKGQRRPGRTRPTRPEHRVQHPHVRRVRHRLDGDRLPRHVPERGSADRRRRVRQHALGRRPGRGHDHVRTSITQGRRVLRLVVERATAAASSTSTW